jgi:hypothetical protein
MKRFALVMLVAASAGITGVAPAAATTGTTICVQKSKPHCYPTLQAAIDAAHDGDTIKLGPGTFAGGVSIAKSIDLVGAGAGATIISGGGPVLTIGVADATSEPTVSVARVTITGGVTHGDSPFAQGGGIQIPAAAGFTLGATVSLRDVVVTGNRAEPVMTSASPSGVKCPDGNDCPFAAAFGGGIYNTGTLSVTKSVISDNLASGVASDADGGGIWSALGAVSITNSVVVGNDAIAAIPNGRFAEGGGLFVESGSLSVKNTVVNGNSAQLTSELPVSAGGALIEMNANSGGIHVGDDVPTLIANTSISGNSVSAVDPSGEPVGFDAAMLIGSGPLTMRNTLITGNHATETVATTVDAGPGGSVLELDGGGTITGTRITGNDMTSISPNGDAAEAGALAVFTFNDDPKLVTVKDSVISGNTSTATSPAGSATVHGAGIYNNSLLDLRQVDVSGNTGTANGLSGAAEGGGIWNGIELSGPPVTLTLEHSSVTRNSLTGSAGIVVRGGGLFTSEPVTLTRSLIARNAPDQCFGC